MVVLEGEDLLLCPTCGTQYDVPATEPLSACRICDDPRQFVPRTGQIWTSLRQERGKHETIVEQYDDEPRLWSITVDPKLGIGERALFMTTDHGNVLWDCFSYLDDDLIGFIKSKGGLKAIVISHPHFYTTHLDWAATFGCKIYTHAADKEWFNREDKHGVRVLIEGKTQEILPGVTAIQTGGHFPGSMVLHWDRHLFHADSFVNVPSGFYQENRPPGTSSFSFMWSIPNMIPLDPDTILGIWTAVEPYTFDSTHGLMKGFDIRSPQVKSRLLESMKIQIRTQGFPEHKIHSLTA